MIPRFINIEEFLNPQRVLIVYGPRRSGKTTLLKDYLSKTRLRYKLDSGDNISTRNILSSDDFTLIGSYIEGYQLLAIDEAQRIPNIGSGLKILVDNNPDLKIIVTGSSSFDLSQQIGEPLTGRKTTLTLFPFAQQELLALYNKHELKEQLENFLIFGSYPEVITAKTREAKTEILVELVNSYLLKDIFSFERLRASNIIIDLLKLIAFQVGNLVSYNELATQLKTDSKTILRYLDLLEKSFVLKKVTGFSRNLRNEISKKNKFYFWDNGIRNAVILQFNSLENRNDIGALFENFISMERTKYLSNNRIFTQSYFWRTYQGSEIDLIEESSGKIDAIEFKYSPKTATKKPEEFLANYQNSSFKIINNQNYLDFVTKG
jgi:predicted AAA+ superfamily ATPase